MKLFVKIVGAFLFTAALLWSCSKPDQIFLKSVMQKSSDKLITEQEYTQLQSQLNEALAKNRQGVRIGTKEIKSEEDMIEYLRSKNVAIEGLAPERKVDLGKFYIFLESSLSMKGYVGKGNPDFVEPLIALFECGDETTQYVTAYARAKGTSDATPVFNEVQKDVFLSNITGGKFVSGESSPIDKMISQAVDVITEDGEDITESVFCLITDGILSGTNQEVASNREFTKNNLPLLEMRIRDAVSKAQKRGLDCVVYRLITVFDGTYYDYRNGHHALNGERPYYMILIGDAVNLTKIEDRLSKESNFMRHQPRRFASFDVASIKTVERGQLKQLPGQNAKVKGNTIIYEPEKAAAMPVVFAIQFNLQSLPSYILDSSELSSRISLSYIDRTSGSLVPIPVGSWSDNIESDPQTKVYKFTINLEPEYLDKMSLSGEMQFLLPGYEDNWYKTYSSSDDVSIVAGDINTFALDRFMGGIMKGFGYEDQTVIPDAIRFKFQVKKP